MMFFDVATISINVSSSTWLKKIMFFGLAIGIAFSFTSCNTQKNSAYKAAYDQAKQQELAQGQSQATDAIEITPVVSNTAWKVRQYRKIVSLEKV